MELSEIYNKQCYRCPACDILTHKKEWNNIVSETFVPSHNIEIPEKESVIFAGESLVFICPHCRSLVWQEAIYEHTNIK